MASSAVKLERQLNMEHVKIPVGTWVRLTCALKEVIPLIKLVELGAKTIDAPLAEKCGEELKELTYLLKQLELKKHELDNPE